MVSWLGFARNGKDYLLTQWNYKNLWLAKTTLERINTVGDLTLLMSKLKQSSMLVKQNTATYIPAELVKTGDTMPNVVKSVRSENTFFSGGIWNSTDIFRRQWLRKQTLIPSSGDYTSRGLLKGVETMSTQDAEHKCLSPATAASTGEWHTVVQTAGKTLVIKGPQLSSQDKT